MSNQQSDFKCEIVERLGVLSTDTKGWRKEINLISYNDKEPKINRLSNRSRQTKQTKTEVEKNDD